MIDASGQEAKPEFEIDFWDRAITINNSAAGCPFPYSPRTRLGGGPHFVQPRRGQYEKMTGKHRTQSNNLTIARLLLLIKWKKVKNWNLDDVSLSSPAVRKRGLEIWTVFRAAEYACVVLGVSFPERARRPLKSGIKPNTNVCDIVGFWQFLCAEIEDFGACRRGPKLNPEKVFKTALAGIVARELVFPNDWWDESPPTPTEVARAWWLLFGEFERPDVVRYRFRATTMLVEAYLQNHSKNPRSKLRQVKYALSRH